MFGVYICVGGWYACVCLELCMCVCLLCYELISFNILIFKYVTSRVLCYHLFIL